MAYAFDDRGSLQNTGSASFFGSSVSPIIELRSGVPTRRRLGNAAREVTPTAQHRLTPVGCDLDALLTAWAQTLTRP